MENVNKYAELESRKAELKDELTQIDAQLAELQQGVLDWFSQNHAQSVKINGRTLYLRREIWAGCAEGVTHEAACAALQGAGYTELCGMKFNSQKVSALFREREKEGQPAVPEELSGAFVANEVFKIGSRRA